MISYKFEYKVTIHNSRLEEHIDLLNQINQVSLIWKKQEHYQNVRLCYVFETKKGNKIFSISMFDPEHMFVNGHQVEGNKIFYDVVMPFLPEDAASELQSFLKKT